MEASGAAIYGFAGWLDGYFIKDMLALHNTVRTPGSRLVIGPWGHGGRWYSSPFVDKKQATDFDQSPRWSASSTSTSARARPRDLDEPPIHYFTMGEERWKTTDQWPLPGTTTVRHYSAPGGRLADEPGSGDHRRPLRRRSRDRHRCALSRFGKHLGGGRYPAKFDDRRRTRREAAHLHLRPVPDRRRGHGTPAVTLHVAADTTDAAFYLYLEDVAPDGGVRYVTDGACGASWRKTGEAPYWTAWPYFPGRPRRRRSR